MVMTPKRKARQLFDKFLNTQSNTSERYDAQQATLICVAEIQEQAQIIEGSYNNYPTTHSFFVEVRKEILKL